MNNMKILGRKEYLRKWRKENPGKTKEYARKNYLNNPEKIKASNCKWREKNRLHIKEYDKLPLVYAKHRIRTKHGGCLTIKWLKKAIYETTGIETQIHHDWIKKTADYNFVCILPAKEHRQGVIKPIMMVENGFGVVLFDKS